MSNIYSPEAQENINSAENKLGDAIKSLKAQSVEVETIPEVSNDVEVEIDAPVKEPRRTEFVKTDDPKVIERINDLYGQAKKSDARNQMLVEHNRQLEEKFAEYQERLNKFEQANKNSASDKVETELKAQKRTAMEDGDYDKAEQIEDKLRDLWLSRNVADKLAPQEKVTPKAQPQEQFDQQYVNNAKYLEFLAAEKDSQGNKVRPYLEDWHPDNQKAVDLFLNIPKEFAAAGRQVDIKTVMEVMDERIRGKKTITGSSVLGGEANDAPARNVIKLTSQEMEIAKRMGIKPEAYARQKQLMNS